MPLILYYRVIVYTLYIRHRRVLVDVYFDNYSATAVAYIIIQHEKLGHNKIL
jgi:hypothetical protein